MPVSPTPAELARQNEALVARVGEHHARVEQLLVENARLRDERDHALRNAESECEWADKTHNEVERLQGVIAAHVRRLRGLSLLRQQYSPSKMAELAAQLEEEAR